MLDGPGGGPSKHFSGTYICDIETNLEDTCFHSELGSADMHLLVPFSLPRPLPLSSVMYCHTDTQPCQQVLTLPAEGARCNPCSAVTWVCAKTKKIKKTQKHVVSKQAPDWCYRRSPWRGRAWLPLCATKILFPISLPYLIRFLNFVHLQGRHSRPRWSQLHGQLLL